MTPANFYHCGGDIFWRGVHLTTSEANALADLNLDEHDAALRAGDRRTARIARSMFLEITDALKAQADWRRASCPVALANPQRRSA